jgi:DNA modification methylase
MRAFFAFQMADLVAQRPPDAVLDVHFPEALAAAVIEEFTAPGDLVLDPFAGYGTTLVVAARMGRRAIGVELADSHLEIIRSRVADTAEVIAGDARGLTALVDEPVDLCLTSPPYMNAVDHLENPLNAYETLDADYDDYLVELGDIFGQVALLLRPGGHLVVNVANIVSDGVVTPLAWDIARVINEHLVFRHEAFVGWDRQPTWMSGDYCFVFQKPGNSAGRAGTSGERADAGN